MSDQQQQQQQQQQAQGDQGQQQQQQQQQAQGDQGQQQQQQQQAQGDQGQQQQQGGAAQGKARDGQQQQQGPPEKYQLQLPEGGPLEAADLEQFEKDARTAGLSNEDAQAALDAEATALREQATALLTDLQAHPEVGGDKLAAAQQAANKVLDTFLPDTTAEGAALRSGLKRSGYGNWTPLVLLLARIGNTLREDQIPDLKAAGPKPEPKPTEDVMFPTSASKAS